jgi:hypothetical protein
MNSLTIDRQEFRASVLAAYGADEGEIKELLAYNDNVFVRTHIKHPIQFPLPSEPHLSAWEKYAVDAKEIGAFKALKQRLVQLQFPIREGISQTQTYRAATFKGISVDGITEASGLSLKHPDRLQLIIHQSLAGAIPVLLTENREDFVSLVQALTKRNEPTSIPDSMGACIVGGFNNWDRIRQYRQQWELYNPNNCSESKWAEEFKRLIPQKQLYQDRFIILSNGFYSNISAKDIGLSESEWQDLSVTIRLEHECTHYFTRRLFNSMRNNLLDELIADYRGIVAAIGKYQADWFLRFLGLESFPKYREGGRLQNYCGQPPLSEGAFKILQVLIKAAAENLEHFHSEHKQELEESKMQLLMLMSLTCLTLEELASQEANILIAKTLNKLQEMQS